MLFSTRFGPPDEENRDWFDPILDHDTKLFIDPFLIFCTNRDDFRGAHEKIISFFNRAFELGARSAGVRTSIQYRKLINLLMFPEAPELCLGYTTVGTAGSGSGRGFSQVIASGILESISVGIVQVEHFEEIGLLHEGIGCDRISDICANLLKEELVTYTQQVCQRYGIPVRKAPIRNLHFNERYLSPFSAP